MTKPFIPGVPDSDTDDAGQFLPGMEEYHRLHNPRYPGYSPEPDAPEAPVVDEPDPALQTGPLPELEPEHIEEPAQVTEETEQ